MNKKQQIQQLQKMCQDYSDLVDKNHGMVEELFATIALLRSKNAESQATISLLESSMTAVQHLNSINFEDEEDPIQQMSKILVSLSDCDWERLGSEVRIHLLNDHSTSWVKHPHLAGKFSTLESIIMNIYEVERGRGYDGSL